MTSALEDGEASFSSREELALLLEGHEPLYAILDPARDPAILELLQSCGEEARSLYNGRRSEQLADVAPYLARVPAGSRLFNAIIREGWGRSWGVLAVCDAPFAELRRHLRRFLVAQTEDRTALYFRFYDPRVLRPLLESATDEQRRVFFGPVSAFLLEGRRENTVLRRARVGPAAPRPKPPWELLTIRDEQMRVFSREMLEVFLDRMESALRPALAARDIRAVMRDEIERARRYGVVSAGALERYLAITAALGPAFDERVPWARAELMREGVDALRKLWRIERRLRRDRVRTALARG
jgi:hypothetical protein